MSDNTPNLNELKDLATKLHNLLRDPHPGLMSWNGILGQLLRDIAMFYDSDYDEAIELADKIGALEPNQHNSYEFGMLVAKCQALHERREKSKKEP